jgi:hypothetical protein
MGAGHFTLVEMLTKARQPVVESITKIHQLTRRPPAAAWKKHSRLTACSTALCHRTYIGDMLMQSKKTTPSKNIGWWRILTASI